MVILLNSNYIILFTLHFYKENHIRHPYPQNLSFRHLLHAINLIFSQKYYNFHSNYVQVFTVTL